MRILQLHNCYQQPGGEDVVVEQERALLSSKGQDVDLLVEDNHSIAGIRKKVRTALGVTYSSAARRRVAERIRTFAPEIVHVHNFVPLFSPSVYYACLDARIPVVQTLHNFRLICPNALLYREGKTCEACVGKTFAWPGVSHACYRNSHVGTAALACMLGIHAVFGTWTKAVGAYIALTNAAREKFMAGGIPGNRIWVKPNFLFPDPGTGLHNGEFALFVGRLSPEKGIQTLITAWHRLQRPARLKIVGDGPLEEEVRNAASANRNIEFLGRQPGTVVQELMKAASFLVFASECHEGGVPRVCIEACATGLPVVASRIGSMTELLADRRGGLLFDTGVPDDLARKVDDLAGNVTMLQKLSADARTQFEERYSAEKSYDILMSIYSRVKGEGPASANEHTALGAAGSR